MDNNYLLFNTISTDAFIMINKKIARSIGIIPALIIGELIYEFKYWSSRGECKDGWFFSTIENIERETGIKEKQQLSAIKQLIDINLIEKKLMGLPAKRYFRINAQKIIELIAKEEKDDFSEEINEFIELSLNNPEFNEFIKKYIPWWSVERTRALINKDDKKSILNYIKFVKLFKEGGAQ
jgi:hypothetical protein